MKKYRVVIVSDKDTSVDSLSSSLRYGWKIETSYRLEDEDVAFVLYKNGVDEELVDALRFIENQL